MVRMAAASSRLACVKFACQYLRFLRGGSRHSEIVLSDSDESATVKGALQGTAARDRISRSLPTVVASKAPTQVPSPHEHRG